MAFIIGKKQGGKTYYHLAEAAGVDGKPQLVSQRYLGSAEEVMVRLGEVASGEPFPSHHLSFGDLGATWRVIIRLQIAEIIDEVVGPRRSDAQASLGPYNALMILNRVECPCSKLGFSQWWSKTAGDHLLHLPQAALDHRRF